METKVMQDRTLLDGHFRADLCSDGDYNADIQLVETIVMIESINIMYLAIHANNTMHKNIPFPQIKLRLIHTRYLVSDLFFVEDCPFVEDFPSEYFHSKDSS